MILDKIAKKTAERLKKHVIETVLDMKMVAAFEISAKSQAKTSECQ
jgi:hypothetical protein